MTGRQSSHLAPPDPDESVFVVLQHNVVAMVASTAAKDIAWLAFRDLDVPLGSEEGENVVVRDIALGIESCAFARST